METKNAIFMIEGGRALEMVRQHIAAHAQCNAEVKAISDELGIKEARRNRTNGKLSSVKFPGAVPPGWTVPDKNGCSRPKRGTEWAKRFNAQVGQPDQSVEISKAFSIPLSIGYTQEHGSGWSCIGNMLNECGFLFTSTEGPYAMWAPDVPAYVAQLEAEGGKTIEEPAKSFRMEFDGCRRIEPEEWDIVVANYRLAQKRAA